ncbi:MAG: hypothetical protein ACRDNF_23430, partial [Streptosporangiaceae bacterium]
TGHGLRDGKSQHKRRSGGIRQPKADPPMAQFVIHFPRLSRQWYGSYAKAAAYQAMISAAIAALICRNWPVA